VDTYSFSSKTHKNQVFLIIFHRSTERLRLEGTCEDHPPYSKQGQLEQAAQDCIQLGSIPTTSLGNLFQRLTVLTLQKYLLMCMLDFLCLNCARHLSSCRCAPLRRVWLHLLWSLPSGTHTRI